MTIGSESSIQVRTRFLNLNHFHEGVDGDVANGGQVAQVRVDHVDVAQDLPCLHLTVHQPGEQIVDYTTRRSSLIGCTQNNSSVPGEYAQDWQ